MSSTEQKQSLPDSLKSVFTVGVIVISLLISYLVFHFILGDPSNFEGNNPAGHPLQGNFLGIIYKGGVIVPILLSLIIILFTFTIERILFLKNATGNGQTNVFIKNIQTLVENDKINDAIDACDEQKGSLGNVVKAGLVRYKEFRDDPRLSPEQKVLALQKELEEATALELPGFSKNLVILSTIASISVLIGLIGTVLGMIRAFDAMSATGGAPDALQLATGISEALINTAFGISGSALAIILYNTFSTQTDKLTFKIDEANYSLLQTFASQVK